MRKWIVCKCCLIAIAASGAALRAQTTQPSDHAALELRATQAFNGGEYALALPMLEKLAEQLAADQPERVALIEEQIRVCQKNLEETEASDPQADSTLKPDALLANLNDPPTSAEERKVHEKPADGETLELTIKELGNFEYDAETGGNVPEDVLALSDVTIQIRGFMIPMDQADRITKFALVPDLASCCFGQPPQIQHTVMVNAPEGKAVSYYPDEIVVEGKLTVEEKKDEGYIVSLFEMTASSVKPAAK